MKETLDAQPAFFGGEKGQKILNTISNFDDRSRLVISAGDG